MLSPKKPPPAPTPMPKSSPRTPKPSPRLPKAWPSLPPTNSSPLPQNVSPPLPKSSPRPPNSSPWPPKVSPPLPKSSPRPPKSLPPGPEKPIEVRSVWAANLEWEFDIISKAIDGHPFVSMDTEFPGSVFAAPTTGLQLSAGEWYSNYLRRNVDTLPLIQVGLTLTDAAGNLPDLGTDRRYIWEFNLRDFHPSQGPYAPSSIAVLRAAGIDFDRNRDDGADSFAFAELLMASGLVCNDEVVWVVFQGSYDLAYLVSALTRRALPAALPDFIELVSLFFGREGVYDVKYLSKQCRLHGGLEGLAGELGLKRAVGVGHQAGSDSLLTWETFCGLREKYFAGDVGLEKHAGVVYGLTGINY